MDFDYPDEFSEEREEEQEIEEEEDIPEEEQEFRAGFKDWERVGRRGGDVPKYLQKTQQIIEGEKSSLERSVWSEIENYNLSHDSKADIVESIMKLPRIGNLNIQLIVEAFYYVHIQPGRIKIEDVDIRKYKPVVNVSKIDLLRYIRLVLT